METQTLIIGPSWVGDMIMAQSLFMHLHQQEPHKKIDVLAPQWSRAILNNMPQVNTVWDMPLGHGQLDLKKRYQMGKSLRNQYDLAIVLPNSFKSALIPFFARIPIRRGFIGEMRYGLLNDWRYLDKKQLPLMVQRFVSLARGANHPLSARALSLAQIAKPKLVLDPARQAQTWKDFDIQREQPVLVLCPGAEFGAAKQWPAAYYAKVAAVYGKKGWQVWLLGSQNDFAIARRIEELCPTPCRNFCGQTTLSQAMDLLALADKVVSNDSGLMHMAAALDRPLVAIYGATDPGFTPPLGEHSRIVREVVPCSPCFKRDCPLGHHDCMNKLEPSKVLAVMEGFFSRSHAPARDRD